MGGGGGGGWGVGGWGWGTGEGVWGTGDGGLGIGDWGRRRADPQSPILGRMTAGVFPTERKQGRWVPAFAGMTVGSFRSDPENSASRPAADRKSTRLNSSN